MINGRASEIVFPKGLLRLDGARIEQIFTKKFAYPLGRAISLALIIQTKINYFV
jgi:hypothetical protein